MLLRSSLARAAFHWLLSQTIVILIFLSLFNNSNCRIDRSKIKKLFRTPLPFFILRQATRTTASIHHSIVYLREKSYDKTVFRFSFRKDLNLNW